MEAKELIKKQKTTSILRIAGWSCVLVLTIIDLVSDKWHRTSAWILIAASILLIIWNVFALRKARKDLNALNGGSSN